MAIPKFERDKQLAVISLGMEDVWVTADGEIIGSITEEQSKLIETELDRLEVEHKRDYVTSKIDNVYSNGYKLLAKQFNNGNPISYELDKIYASKLQAVKDGNVEYFEAEAQVMGTTSTVEFNKVKQLANMLDKTSFVTGTMEGVRRKLNQLVVSKEFNKVNSILDNIIALPIEDINPVTISKLFKD